MVSQQFGAWIAAAITALQITLNSVGMPAQQISNFLADPFNVVYTYQDSQLDQYFDQSNIQILPGNTIIDGVVYDDVWLSESAAEKFRVNAFDFTSAYSIASNTNGTFASGYGYCDTIPLYSTNLGANPVRSQSFTLTGNGDYTVGNFIVKVRDGSNTSYKSVAVTDPGGHTNSSSSYSSGFPNEFYFYVLNPSSSSPSLRWGLVNGGGSNSIPSSYLNKSEFDFDYVSGTIPADTPLASDEGLLIHIPHHSGTSHLEQFIDDNPEFAEPGGIEIDPTIDPDIYTKLDDLINIIAPLIPVINAEFSTAPDPAPVPIPDDTIADTLFSELRTILNNIIQTITSIPTAISALGDRILEDIELGPIRVFQKVLDLFRTIFAPVINLITAGIGIWSYVVSWLSAISLPFNFMLSVIPSGIMIPIYAGVAGWLVIAIFRRFGR